MGEFDRALEYEAQKRRISTTLLCHYPAAWPLAAVVAFFVESMIRLGLAACAETAPKDDSTLR
jgi:hypothetical protein